MLPLIVQHSETLISFIFALQFALYQPQIQHLLEIVDALIVCNQRKTLSGLSRLLHHSVDPKALADFFRENPWSVELISQPRKKFMLAKILELAQTAGIVPKIMVSLDDSLGKKGKATKHLDAVDDHHNHTESTRKRQSWCNGYVYVELHVQIGPFGFLFDTRLYLREKKVRKLNCLRAKEKRLRYRSKYNLTREMLLDLDTLLPEGSQVYTLAINYLQYTAMLAYRPKQPLPSLAECKRLHQQAHLDSLLRCLVTEIKKQPQRVEAIRQAYLPTYVAGA